MSASSLLELQQSTTAFGIEGVSAHPVDAHPVDAPDQERLRRVVSEQCGFVWRTLRRFGVPESQADDATQMVFLAFASHAPDVEEQRERAFLAGTCFRIAANVRRGLSRNKETSGLYVEDRTEHDPESLLDLKRRRQALDRALGTLPEDQRAVYVLFELEGFSLPEIARSLHVRLGTATSRLQRARVSMASWVKRIEKNGDWR